MSSAISDLSVALLLTPAAFEIEGDVIRVLYVLRNPEKLRHLAAAAPQASDGAVDRRYSNVVRYRSKESAVAATTTGRNIRNRIQ